MSKLGYSPVVIIDELLHLRGFVDIADASEDEIRKHRSALRDKSDVPVGASAIKSIFITGGEKFRKRAAGHLKVMTAAEVAEKAD